MRYRRHMSAIRELREASGLSQRNLARPTGIAQPNIAAYEAGRRPTTDTVLERVRAVTQLRP